MILLDVNQIVIANFVVQTRQASFEVPNPKDVREAVLRSIANIRVSWSKDYGQLVVCCDASKQNWRHRLFPYYKMGRRKARAASKYSWATIFQTIPILMEELHQHFPYKVLRVHDAEADDIIASVCFSHGVPGKASKDILVVSGDKDLKQLLRFRNVQVYNPMTKRALYTNAPGRDLHEHIMRGDHSDGVPNFLSDDDTFVVPGKKQKPLLEVKLTKWLDLPPEDYCDQRMLANYKRNKALIDFECIPRPIHDACMEAYNSTSIAPAGRVRPYLMEQRLNNIMPRIQELV